MDAHPFPRSYGENNAVTQPARAAFTPVPDLSQVAVPHAAHRSKEYLDGFLKTADRIATLISGVMVAQFLHLGPTFRGY